MKLKNKTVVITGGAGGLGRAMAETVSRQGAKIALIDINAESLESLSAKQAQARGYGCDLCNEQHVVDTFQSIINDFGTIDVLVNNAGITDDALIYTNKKNDRKKLPLTQFQSVLDVNLTGSFLCAREAIAHMVEAQTKGLIVNISSISRAGNYGQTNYSASKAAVVAMTTTWAKELARHSIRAASIAPGFIATEMVAKMPDHVIAKLCSQIPAGRMGDPAEIAHALQFIIENEYFNGRVLELDGGLRL